MKNAPRFLFLLTLVSTASAQGLPCVTAFKHFAVDHRGQLERPSVPIDIQRHLPTGAVAQIVLPLSTSDTLTIYGSNAFDPDTRFLVTRRAIPIARFAIKELPSDHDWGKSLRAMGAVHLCASDRDLTYVVLETGNQGGYFVLLTPDQDQFRLLPIKAVTQGRLVLTANSPSRMTVWDVASEDAGDCTACSKHYIVESLEFDGKSFRVVEKRKTTKKYHRFQDDPLKLIH